MLIATIAIANTTIAPIIQENKVDINCVIDNSCKYAKLASEYPSESEIKEAIRYICNNYGIDYDCFNAIVRYESSYINQCNQTYGCIAGMGLTQIITPTALRCEEKLGREINPLKPKDALECGAWLLANEGTKHWGTEYTDWGSWEKWNTYCQRPLVVGFTEI